MSSPQVRKRPSGWIHIQVTKSLALALACLIFLSTEKSHLLTQQVFILAACESSFLSACFVCTWKSLGSLPFTLSFEEISPSAYLHTRHFPATEVATKALYWTKPRQVYRIQEPVIPVCELSHPFAFLPLHLWYLCVRKFYCMVTSPSVSGKNTNTSICLVLCSLQNDITYTNLL